MITSFSILSLEDEFKVVDVLAFKATDVAVIELSRSVVEAKVLASQPT
jgi:hypothetical protein